MPISSQANGRLNFDGNQPKEGSETIPKGSRVQADSKRPAPNSWGDDIVLSSWKREAALKALVSKISFSETGCWEWTGSTTLGYGCLKIQEIYGDFKIMAHRLSWVAFKGEPINDGLFVCHKCDNPKCFNPDHLFLGTQKENMIDCSMKYRTISCDHSNLSKYTTEDIEKVKKLLSEKKTGKEISAITGISCSHISRIKRGYTWKLFTQRTADMQHSNRKYTDQQILNAAKLVLDGSISTANIAKLSGVGINVVRDMKRGRAYKRFLDKAGHE